MKKTLTFGILLSFCFCLSCKRKTAFEVQVVNHFSREPLGAKGVSFSLTENHKPIIRQGTSEEIYSFSTDDNGRFVLNFKAHHNEKYDYVLKLKEETYNNEILTKIYDTLTEVLQLYDIREFEDEWRVRATKSKSFEIDAVPLSRFKIILTDVAPYGDNDVSFTCHNELFRDPTFGRAGIYSLSFNSKTNSFWRPVYYPVRTNGSLVIEWTIRGKNGKIEDFYDSISVNPSLKNKYRINF